MDILNSLNDDQVALLGCGVALILCGGAMVISHTLRRWVTGAAVRPAGRRNQQRTISAATDSDQRKAA